MGEYDENQRFPKVTEVTKGAEGWLKIKDEESGMDVAVHKL